jgi:anti-sigma-K factor RskA
MSDLPPPAEPDDADLLAGEYVLGTLDAAAMASVRGRAATDPALADAIAVWERRLAPLADAVPPVLPPPGLWRRLEQAIAVPPVPANDPAKPSLWRSVRLWQGTTAAALALAAAFAAVALLPGQPAPMRFAALGTPGAAATVAPGYMAKAMPDGTLVVAAVAPAPVPAGREMELWILPPGADRPASLGMLPAAGRSITVASMPATGTHLMISLEPPGGSPTGAPSGPVVYAGVLVTV